MISVKQLPCHPWHDFIYLPWTARLYKDNLNWVPNLISEDKKLLTPNIHPFHRHGQVQLFVAYSDEMKPLGRIAAIINEAHNKLYNDQAGFFGLFECINDKAVAQELFTAAAGYLKNKGMKIMRGPMNFSTNETCGLLVEGFDSPPMFMMTYNPSYYMRLFDDTGLIKSKDLFAWYVDDTLVIPNKMIRVAERVKSHLRITVRRANMKHLDTEIKIIQEVYNKAWSNNWGFVPMTDEEFEYMAKDMKKIVDPSLLLIAEVQSKPAGFSLALPNFNMALKHINGRLFPFGIFKLLWHIYIKKFNNVRVITMGIIPEYQKRGIDVLFYLETIKNGMARGYKAAELSWILENNVLMNRTIESLGARLYKKYRLYDKAL
ncbi:MAG: N-acetyltransferase [Candidatus Brocadiia bacterium]